MGISQDKHQAPTLPHSTPCPYRTEADIPNHSPIRLAKIIRVLLDKKGILAGAVFPWPEPAQAEQIERLRSLIYWFWHDLSHHFITSMARGQIWSAYGALGDLRLTCVNLARLQQNFQAEAEGYEKVEQAISVEQLSPLRATFCPLEQGAMLQAALVIVRFYQDLAPLLAETHGIPYPADLDRVIYGRLEQLCDARLH